MNYQVLFVGLAVAGFGLLLTFCETLYRKKLLDAEYTRKLAHVLACLGSLSFLFLFDSHYYPLVVGVIFGIFLFLCKRKNWLHSINAVKRDTEGAAFIPLGIYLPFLAADLLDNWILFALPLLLLGISDPAAWFVGSNYAKDSTHWLKRRFNKTPLGSMAFFVSAFVISLGLLALGGYSGGKMLLLACVIALTACVAEILSPRGIDNLSVPATGVLILMVEAHYFL